MKKILLYITVLATVVGCSRDFLKPDPLSFYEPTVTFTSEGGLQAVLATCDRQLRAYWTNQTLTTNNVPIAMELLFSDVAICGKTDMAASGTSFLMATITPSSIGDGTGIGDGLNISHFWVRTYDTIKSANTVISYIDNVEGLSEEVRNEYKGRAYFHRAFRYMNLVFQFGDVPLVTKLTEVPKQNYRSTTKEAILEMITLDMEKAVEWVPDQSAMSYVGMVNKGACRMLLSKLYLATGQWQKAKDQLDILINQSGYSLMKEPFGAFNPGGEPQTWEITRNVIWDMHRPENRLIPENREVIMGMPNRGAGEESFISFQTMRIFGPMWDNQQYLIAPDAIRPQAFARNDDQGRYRVTADLTRAFGRGIATVRSTPWFVGNLWKVNGVVDEGDLRHSRETGNWVEMEDLIYNNPTSSWYGRSLMKYYDGSADNNGTIPANTAVGTLLCTDTIRHWFAFPHYKIWLFDQSAEATINQTNFAGATSTGTGNADWYLYRLAEAYLLRAEAKYYMGDATAVDDVNEVRRRAHCTQLYTTVTIGDIMDERARELYLEEWRNVELTRVSLCLALSGKPDEWGYTYSVDNFDKQSGTDAVGGSYWWQRIMHNSVYNKGIRNSRGIDFNYTLDKHNLYWPVPQASITANNKGVLSQNYGYDGYDASVPKWENWEDAVADEDVI